jgi:hypothetical protein
MREFTQADVNAVILQLGDKQPDKPTRRSAKVIAWDVSALPVPPPAFYAACFQIRTNNELHNRTFPNGW